MRELTIPQGFGPSGPIQVTIPSYSLFDNRGNRSLTVAVPPAVGRMHGPANPNCPPAAVCVACRARVSFVRSFCQPLRRPAPALATAIGKAFQVQDGVNDEFSFGAEFAKDSVHVHGCGSFRVEPHGCGSLRRWNHTGVAPFDGGTTRGWLLSMVELHGGGSFRWWNHTEVAPFDGGTTRVRLLSMVETTRVRLPSMVEPHGPHRVH